jgi:ribosomal protein S6
MVKDITHNYEIMCILPEKREEEIKKLTEEIQRLIQPAELKSKLENKKLAYKIGNLETADYLILNFNTSPKKIISIEAFIQQSSFIIRYLLINQDSETKIKISKKHKESQAESESKLKETAEINSQE